METIQMVAGVVFCLGFYPYLDALTQRLIRPPKSTWLIWATVDWMLFAGMYAGGTMNGQILGACIGSTVVAILTLFYGAPGWSTLDKRCLLVAALGVGLWQVTDYEELSITVSTIVLLVGSLPLIRSAVEDPTHQSKGAWTLYFASCVLTVIAIPEWDFGHVVPVLSFVIPDTAMMYLVVVRPLWHRRV